MGRMKNMINFTLLNLIIYIPFHLFEEAVGDFPKWMYEHKWLPYHMTHGHWMANNIFIYYPMLLSVALIYIFNEKLLCFGVGILIWGLINFGDHFFYTIKDKKVSPGLITGFIFLITSVWGLRFYVLSDDYLTLHLIIGIFIGGLLFGLPIGLCVVTYKFFDKFIK